MRRGSRLSKPLLRQPIETGPLCQSGWGQCEAGAQSGWENVQQQPALQPAERFHRTPRLELGHVLAERFDQFSVLNARWTRSLAGPAIQAEIEMILDRFIQFQLAVNDAAHQVNAAAWAIGFQPVLDVGRTSRRAKSAVDAVENEFVVDGWAASGQDIERRFFRECNAHRERDPPGRLFPWRKQ